MNKAGNHETERPLITLRLSIDEGRWLVTAITVTLRLLEGLHLGGREAQRFQIHGLAALHRIADRLPSGLSGYYPTSDAFQDEPTHRPEDTAEETE